MSTKENPKDAVEDVDDDILDDDEVHDLLSSSALDTRPSALRAEKKARCGAGLRVCFDTLLFTTLDCAVVVFVHVCVWVAPISDEKIQTHSTLFSNRCARKSPRTLE